MNTQQELAVMADDLVEHALEDLVALMIAELEAYLAKVARLEELYGP